MFAVCALIFATESAPSSCLTLLLFSLSTFAASTCACSARASELLEDVVRDEGRRRLTRQLVHGGRNLTLELTINDGYLSDEQDVE